MLTPHQPLLRRGGGRAGSVEEVGQGIDPFREVRAEGFLEGVVFAAWVTGWAAAGPCLVDVPHAFLGGAPACSTRPSKAKAAHHDCSDSTPR